MTERARNDNLRLLFEDGCNITQSAERIAGITRDLRSWWRFMQMEAGGAPALMQTIDENGNTHRFKVAYSGDLRSGATFENT